MIGPGFLDRSRQQRRFPRTRCPAHDHRVSTTSFQERCDALADIRAAGKEPRSLAAEVLMGIDFFLQWINLFELGDLSFDSTRQDFFHIPAEDSDMI